MAANESDLAARLMGDMDPGLLDFLKTRVNSFVKWDLVRFFHENPHTTDTAENVARYAKKKFHCDRCPLGWCLRPQQDCLPADRCPSGNRLRAVPPSK